MFMTGFRCVSCETVQAADFSGYVCPACGSNLDVTYDYQWIRASLDLSNPFVSSRQDIFKYAPLLPIRDIAHAPPLRIGSTPLYHAKRLGDSVGLRALFLKDDGLNPSASFKDRASAVAITRAVEMGAAIVAGASTGNAGSSMACMAASLKAPCVIFVPQAAPPAKIAQLQIFGARVMAVRGTYDEAFDLCLQFCAKHGWFNRNTGYNPFTREGKKTCSFEICEQLGWKAPDRIVVPTGDGNIISGIWKGLKDLHAIGLIDRLPKLVCAQSEASDAISRTVWALQKAGSGSTGAGSGSMGAGTGGTRTGKGGTMDWTSVQVESVRATTVADSISVDVPRDGLAAVRAVMESEGVAVTVPDEEILAAIRELALEAGVFAEPAAATSWACLKKLAGAGAVGPDEVVVCLISGNGLKDIASARKVAGEPTIIDPTIEAAEAHLL